MPAVLRVVLSEVATAELDAAYRWYGIQRDELAEELLDEFLACVERVAAAPNSYPAVDGETRRAPLQRFPYGLYYRIGLEELVVVGVFHGKRDPIKWQGRR